MYNLTKRERGFKNGPFSIWVLIRLFGALTSMEPFLLEQSDKVFDANDAKDLLLALASLIKPFSTDSSSFPSFPLSSDNSPSPCNFSMSDSGIGIFDSQSILLPIIGGSAVGDLVRVTL